MPTLRHLPDPSVGSWTADRLQPLGHRVCSVVPQGFEAYARVLHPVEPADGGALERWADVAARTGRTMHPRAQFWAVAGMATWHDLHDGAAPEGQPDQGNLEPGTLAAVLDVLARHTPGGPDAPVVAALWEGWGWLDGAGVATFSWPGPGPAPVVEDRHVPAAFPPEVLAAPRLLLPHRAYLLFGGPLGALTAVEPPWAGGPGPQSPSLLWPRDRSWCLATEIDLDSTFVGGPQALVDDLLADPRLEAWPARPDDPVTYDGDDVNSPTP